MDNKTLGGKICFLRKKKGMTQNDLAAKMNVTDKAVSKWERNLSCPDLNSFPRLAEVLDVSVDELLNTQNRNQGATSKIEEIANIALIGVGIAMGVGVVITSMLDQVDVNSAIIMLGIGLGCMGIYLLETAISR